MIPPVVASERRAGVVGPRHRTKFREKKSLESDTEGSDSLVFEAKRTVAVS